MASTACLSSTNSIITFHPSKSKVFFQNSSVHKYCVALNTSSRFHSSRVFAADSNPSTELKNIFRSNYDGMTDILKTRSKQRLLKEKCKASTIAMPGVQEVKEFSLPSWAEFELGRAPVFWKTMNGLPPTSGGFNQPIMCGGEPRLMRIKERGEADLPIYTIKIQAPKYAVSLIFSFTNGVEWDGPYKLQFQVLKKWRNKPMIFFNEVSGGAGQLLVGYYGRLFGSGSGGAGHQFISYFRRLLRLQNCRIPGLWKKHSIDVDFLFRHRLGDRFQSSAKDIVLFFSDENLYLRYELESCI